MGVARRLAGDGPQPEALVRIEAGGLEPTVVERQCLRLAVLQKKLAVVGFRQCILDDAFQFAAVQAGAGVEQLVGVGKMGHGCFFLVYGSG